MGSLRAVRGEAGGWAPRDLEVLQDERREVLFDLLPIMKI